MQPSQPGLPPPSELAARVEESKTSAKLLLQVIQSTPEDQVLSNELIKEFGNRCQSAQRDMQQYINSENPPPDDDTMQTLIETNEQLSLACSKFHRAVWAARKSMGATSPPPLGEGIPHQSMNSVSTISGLHRQQTFSVPQPPQAQFPRESRPTVTVPPGPPPTQIPQTQPPQEMYSPPTSPARQAGHRTMPQQVPFDTFTSEAADPFSDDHRAPSPRPSRNLPNSSGPHRHPEEPLNYGTTFPPSHAQVNNDNRVSTLTHDSYNPNLDYPDNVPSPIHLSSRSDYGGTPTQFVSPSAHADPRPAMAFTGTPSYVKRQDSAANGIIMHGAHAPSSSLPASPVRREEFGDRQGPAGMPELPGSPVEGRRRNRGDSSLYDE